MTIMRTLPVGEGRGEGCGGGGGGGGGGEGRTVVVGVKLDQQSRELLTWSLVKVAQPGDRVIALHVLGNTEILDREGKSSLLSLVKAFDSVLAVYEGFCNLKQVDLKLKICRGSSIRKVLVREAKSYVASKVIVGTATHHHTIGSSVSIAKYCARKLSKDCWVLAVNNGKIVFEREATSASTGGSLGAEERPRKNFLTSIHRSLSKNSKVLSDATATATAEVDTVYNEEAARNSEADLLKSVAESLPVALKRNCSICAPDSISRDTHCSRTAEEPNGCDSEGNSLALVPVQTIEAASSSISLLIREVPELRPGWPLLRRSILPDRKAKGSAKSSVKQISVVQWAMRIPGRNSSAAVHPDCKQASCDKDEDCSSNLDGQNGAIVPVDTDAIVPPASPYKNLPKELEGLHEKYSATCRLFNYQELVSATSNFTTENLIGKGGSSRVYRGHLPDGKELAVKILNPSEDVLNEFVLEIEIITALHHKNITSLFGFCFEENNLLLVYDFLPRGSLEENLHGNKRDDSAFGWSERYKVALGVAEALDYLHSRSDQAVIHRDVKSSNILLSDDFEPQLSDFGLAKWASSSSSHITCTDVAGTFGYLAPEYFMYGKVNDKIDVYAFGVVLLELLSGRKPISSDCPKGQESLVMWAKPILNGGKTTQLLDPCLGDIYDPDQMEKMVLAATLCIRRSPQSRPRMSLVLKLLQGDAEISKWARMQVDASEQFDTLDDEAVPPPNIQSHLNVALLDVEDDSLSISSSEQSVPLEDYLQGRWSRSSSFD
uniref:Protein kinase domain-containing protein n=1 Tax=Nelumbo nucifera TaxID=4432 RepID=A0A822Z7Z3_NELNU|nr:TPA_asm: hypothetical protein HUJ06_014124 [Nelumbo nucifera]